MRVKYPGLSEGAVEVEEAQDDTLQWFAAFAFEIFTDAVARNK